MRDNKPFDKNVVDQTSTDAKQEAPQPLYAPGLLGWQCPKCGTVNGPLQSCCVTCTPPRQCWPVWC